MADCSVSALLASATNFASLSEHFLHVLTVQLLCEIKTATLNSGASGQVLTGDGPPVAPPTSNAAIYLNTDLNAVQVLYYWDGAAWVVFG